MTMTPELLELYRQRWHRARQVLRLTDPGAEDFATGGLPGWGAAVHARLVILPADPDGYRLDFDPAYWDWWMQNWPDPIPGQPAAWGPYKRPTSNQGFRCSSPEEADWYRYIGLWHHGGLDVGLGREGAAEWRESLAFRLLTIVGRLWAALSLYRSVAEKFQVAGPFEVTLALRGTENARLGDFGSGWAEVGSGYEGHSCSEKGLLFRREVNEWPDEDGAQQLALSLGGQMEDAWGTESRRFLVHNGPLAGQFDRSTYQSRLWY